jgi:HSP20 family protein
MIGVSLRAWGFRPSNARRRTRMLYGPDPFRDMRRLQNEVSRMAERGTARASAFPAVNAYANQDGMVITAELPGVKSEDLDVSVHRDAVTLSGERQTDIEEAKGYHRRERWQGRFVRTLSLPFGVDPNGVEAAMNNGVLRLELPRAEEDKPRRINVKAR